MVRRNDRLTVSVPTLHTRGWGAVVANRTKGQAMLIYNRRPLNHVGDTITKRYGRTTITLIWSAEGIYTVTTHIGITAVLEHCKVWMADNSGPDSPEQAARNHAAMLAQFYNQLDNYQWPLCGCNETGWIALGNNAFAPCGGCNRDGSRPLSS